MSAPFDYAGLADRRLNTKIESYDMITAVTQRGINAQFEAMYKVEPSLWKLEVKRGECVTMSANLAAPRVSLYLRKDQSVLFYLSIKDGWFEWYNRDEGVAERTSMTNWVLAFDVDLDTKKLEDGSIPPNIVEALKKSGVGQAGNYSVRQLFIDFTTARLSNYNEKESVLPGLEANTGSVSEVASARVAFTTYVKDYLEHIKSSNGGSGIIIAFVPEFTNPTVFHAPSIPPTALCFQNYPFRATPGGNNPDVQGLELGKHNMLLYLEMTNKRNLPNDKLGTSEPWVVPGIDNRLVDGCVALSRRIFLDEWFIPRLTDLNKCTDITAWYAKYKSGFNTRFEYGWARGCVNGVDYNFKYGGIVNNEALYIFEHPSELKDGKKYFTRTSANVKNVVSIPLATTNGECVIKIAGYTWAEVKFNAVFNTLKYWGEMKWNAAFKFKAVADGGGLEVVMDPPVPVEPVVNGGKEFGKLGHFGFKGVDPREEIKATLPTYETGPMLRELNDLFMGSWQFYFAGAGDFFFKNPVFNREADLLLELQYKGV